MSVLRALPWRSCSSAASASAGDMAATRWRASSTVSVSSSAALRAATTPSGFAENCSPRSDASRFRRSDSRFSSSESSSHALSGR